MSSPASASPVLSPATPPRTPRQNSNPSLSSSQRTAGSEVHQNLSSSGRRSKATPSASGNTPTPSKLRRKATVEDAFENVVSVQRLVEYFVIVSCQPRNETSSNRKRHKGPPTPTNPRQESSLDPLPILQVDNSDDTDVSTGPQRKSPKELFRRSKTGGEKGIHQPLMSNEESSSSQQDETREEIILPPKPQGTWKRDEEQVDGNIRMPDAGEPDDYTFQPKITSRYPLSDHPDNPLNPMVTQFCHPVGDVIVPGREYQMPRVHHFVLTNDKGRKIYGTCLTVFEEYEPPLDAPIRAHRIHDDSGEREIEVTVSEEDTTLYLPRCLCILSIWPYMSAFREYLAQLYRLATTTNCMTVPLERHIMNICMEIPAPPPGAFEVQINILDSVIRFWSPPAKLPIAYVSIPYRVLFDCLDIDNILHLWYCLIMEQKVLLVSSQYSNLTVCAEILCSLLYPMKWTHLYVPLLPRFLCPMLDAPVPYLCGVTRDNWLHVQQFVSDETIVVDLDRNNVMFGQQTPKLPSLPGKKWKKLKRSLEDIVGHLFWRTRGLEKEYESFRHDRMTSSEFKKIARQKGERDWNEKLVKRDQAFDLHFTPDSQNLENSFNEEEQHRWDRVQEAFLRFFVAVLKDYRSYLDTPNNAVRQTTAPDANDWLQWSQQRSFNSEAFIHSQKAEYLPFLQHLTMTQHFDDFITKRLYSPEMPDIIFFDQSIDAKLNRSRLKLHKVHTPFLQSAKTHKDLQKFQAVAPSSLGIDGGGPFVYKTFPETLNPNLFGSPRPIPSMITAEFDRQAALISRLRATYSPETSNARQLIDLYSGDYDPSPEGMTFTLFFYAYSAVIGQEWQVYQRKQRELDAQSNWVDETGHGIGSNRGDESKHSSAAEVEIADPDAETSGVASHLGLCDGCPQVSRTIDDALVYVTMTPCPRRMDDFNVQAKSAFDMITEFTNAQLSFVNGRSSSLVDGEQGFAEYEEAHDVAVAQLDLAFDALRTMELRGLFSDSEIFKSLMEACGRCGDTARALKLIQMMQKEGVAADREVLSCFMTAFAHQDETSDLVLCDDFGLSRDRSSDAYSTLLKNQFKGTTSSGVGFPGLLPSESEDTESAHSDGAISNSESDITNKSITAGLQTDGIFDWFRPREDKKVRKKVRRKRRKRRKQRSEHNAVPDRVLKQLVLGESLLEFLYPDLKIDTDCDSCPQCSTPTTKVGVIGGWQPRSFQDFTTCCHTCSHRFVPRFTVSCSAPSFIGSQGVGTPLYCEFLSPWVLRKELGHVIANAEQGIGLVLDPEWRQGTQVSAALWWNLIVLFKHYGLPFSFLLQGSFKNRLIAPVPQDN